MTPKTKVRGIGSPVIFEPCLVVDVSQNRVSQKTNHHIQISAIFVLPFYLEALHPFLLPASLLHDASLNNTIALQPLI